MTDDTDGVETAIELHLADAKARFEPGLRDIGENATPLRARSLDQMTPAWVAQLDYRLRGHPCQS